MKHTHWNLNFATDTQTGSTGLVFLVIKQNDSNDIDHNDKQSEHNSGLTRSLRQIFYTRHTDRIDRFGIPRNKTIPSVIHFKGHSNTRSTSRQINTTRSDNSWTDMDGMTTRRDKMEECLRVNGCSASGRASTWVVGGMSYVYNTFYGRSLNFRNELTML